MFHLLQPCCDTARGYHTHVCAPTLTSYNHAATQQLGDTHIHTHTSVCPMYDHQQPCGNTTMRRHTYVSALTPTSTTMPVPAQRWFCCPEQTQDSSLSG
mmetsp:Transcript_26284/g.67839  ORF Transcript_26284/g.67839 Transcript_26284/m.67839 type:complete len:99 (-) Transcript_26284:2052-2348(-)